MDFLQIDISKITLSGNGKFINIEYEDKPFEIKFPKVYIPFGIEEKFKNYYLNLQLNNYKNDNYQNSFLLFIENLEKQIIEKLGIDKELFNSQISYRKNDIIMIYTKIMEKFRKFTTKVYKDNRLLNIFNLGKEINIDGTIIIDKIWKIKGKYYYKLKLSNICVL